MNFLCVADVVAPQLAEVAEGGFMDILNSISNFGILVVIGAVAVIFLTKVLNHLLQQNTTIMDTVTKKLDEIINSVHTNQANLIDSLSSHNSHNNTMMNIQSKDLEDIKQTLDILRILINEIEDRTVSIDEKLGVVKIIKPKPNTTPSPEVSEEVTEDTE